MFISAENIHVRQSRRIDLWRWIFCIVKETWRSRFQYLGKFIIADKSLQRCRFSKVKGSKILLLRYFLQLFLKYSSSYALNRKETQRFIFHSKLHWLLSFTSTYSNIYIMNTHSYFSVCEWHKGQRHWGLKAWFKSH